MSSRLTFEEATVEINNAVKGYFYESEICDELNKQSNVFEAWIHKNIPIEVLL